MVTFIIEIGVVEICVDGVMSFFIQLVVFIVSLLIISNFMEYLGVVIVNI